MEFLLLPHYRGNHPTPVPKTPYLCKERYDCGPFLSYPARVGRPHAGTVYVDRQRYARIERINPTPILDQDSFIQTWLFFGLITEFIGANSEDAQDQSSSPTKDNKSQSSKEIISQLYETLVVQEGGRSYVSLNADGLQSFLTMARPRFPQEPLARFQRLHHLEKCLRCAYAFWVTLPSACNHSVKFSIGAVGEVFSQTLLVLAYREGQEKKPVASSFGFSNDYLLDQEVQTSMIARGWCPSDIARAQNNFSSLQILHIARMMDKSLPQRDHSKCSDMACNACQINMAEYELQHRQENCDCTPLTVDSQAVTQILQDAQIPLLRLVGDLNDLRAEIVPSGKENPYIAISHVWADGLGNPFANSLQRCQLLHLWELITAIHKSQPGDSSEVPLLWIDTLCCPAADGPGKQLAIQKLQAVYRQAKHVLVLDAGLMAYESQLQDIPEKLVRIFTSAWMRRLWTLQEGALADSLYFQFADEAVSLNDLNTKIMTMQNSIRHMSAYRIIIRDFQRLQYFFHPGGKIEDGPSKLTILDEALLYRSVSVPSDEALCIGTLMSLNISAILAVAKKEDRMQKVWELIASSGEGIPSAVIFFEESKIDAPGWRWAPRSLLSPEKSIHASNLRRSRWEIKSRGTTDSRGLCVQYPGYRITLKQYSDRKLRNPWPGINRIGEWAIQFQDLNTGKWYEIGDKKYALKSKGFKTDEERLEYQKLSLFPLHDLADKDKSVLLLNGNPEALPVDGLFGILVNTEDVRSNAKEAIVITVKFQVLVSKLPPDHAYVYQILDMLALKLRDNEVTERHLQLYNQLENDCPNSVMLAERMKEDEEFKTSIDRVRQMFKDAIGEVTSHDKRFTTAVETYIEKGLLEYIWVMIPDRFNKDYLGEALEDDQVWFVD
jgi:hypothetical protein